MKKSTSPNVASHVKVFISGDQSRSSTVVSRGGYCLFHKLQGPGQVDDCFVELPEVIKGFSELPK
jgi:hypothetical protein